MQIFVEKTLFFVQGGEIGQPLTTIYINLRCNERFFVSRMQ